MKRHALIFIASLALGGAGCQNAEDDKQAQQTAAKVNNEAITVQQLATTAGMTRTQNEAERKQISKQLLERLIDQELLAQKARERNLERDPRVVQVIEASKRQILSQAYLDQLAAQAGKPTQDEIRKFYREHPELFAERRVYRLQEIAIGNAPGLTRTALDFELAKARSMNDIVAWLRAEKIPFQTNATVKPAEQLPMEMLPRLSRLAEGQLLLMPTAQGYALVQVASSDKQPLDEQQATPFIEQFLQNQRKLELAQNEVKALRSAAKIEYVGEFATPAPPAAAPEKPPAPQDSGTK
jgi:EpsD family peptidyl-prolyl cis-trans isomerase